MRAGRLLAGAVLVVMAGLLVLWLSPIAWMFATGLKPAPEIFALPPRWIPREPTLHHVHVVLTRWPFTRWMVNSLVVATATTVLSTLVSVPAAFAFSRLQWRGRDVLFLIFLSSMLIPLEVNVIPLYFLMNRLHLLNTYPAVFLPMVGMPLGIFLLRQFFLNIPTELDDAARVDGAGNVRILLSIIVPLAKPALAALVIYMFTFAWNEFFWSMIALSSPQMFTLPIGLRALQGAYDIDYGILMAGAALAALPALVLFLTLQQAIIRGITMTAHR
ncbi:MAG: carbohydrate ABC transporter permease [Armatimonadota bacterium]|nr:carbohydrate ABC transporter permease [Armatimonadota bacterium]MDR7535996.1 carbohydrate ABC transporter permease [Armatimonadota bacterium]